MASAGADYSDGERRLDASESHTSVGRRILEGVIFAGPFFALLGSAPGDLYLTLCSVAFLVWRAVARFRPQYELAELRDAEKSVDARAITAPMAQWYRAPWFIAAVAFWIWTLVSSAFAADPAGAFRDAAVWIRFPVFAAAVWLLIGASPILRKRLLQGMILGSLAMAAILFHERLNNPEAQRLYGPWRGAPKPAWYMLGYGLPVAYWAVLQLERSAVAVGSARGLGALAMLVLFPLATFITGEMMNTASFALGLLVLAAFGCLSPKRFLMLGGVLALGFVIFLMTNDQAMYRYTEYLAIRLPWLPTSDYYPGWYGGWSMAWSNWAIGVGPGGFQETCRMVGPETLGVETCIPHPHQAFLQMFAETGLPGLLLFSLATLSTWVYAWRRWRETGDMQAGAALALLVIAFLPFATYSDAFGQHKNFYTWFNAGLALAWAAAASRHAGASREA